MGYFSRINYSLSKDYKKYYNGNSRVLYSLQRQNFFQDARYARVPRVRGVVRDHKSYTGYLGSHINIVLLNPYILGTKSHINNRSNAI